MKPTMENLERIRNNSRNHPDEIFTRLYRYLLRPDLYFAAYKNLYANKGASTKGVDNDTADGFSKEKVERIIQSLAIESYSPKPVCLSCIKKKTAEKQRPLGIPSFTDKLLLEALRMILEAVYEPTFSPCSHGFRPHRNCHTALQSLKMEFTDVSWCIEGNINGCFDNIDHNTLIQILQRKVKDARLIKLIWKFLKAGYLEDWKYHATYSGYPQGGIISPLLANIYFNELDQFAGKNAREFSQPRERANTVEHDKICGQLSKLRKRWKAQLLQTPCASKTDKVMKYIRYADNFIIGVKGSREDCEKIKAQFADFISNQLKMELSQEKTLITHSSQYAKFLGYLVRVRRDSTAKPVRNHLIRSLNGKVELCVPFQEKIIPFLFRKSIIKQKPDGTIEPIARKFLYTFTDLEIMMIYNAELREMCNYYGLAHNFHGLKYFANLMECSCLKTLAGKHKTTTRKIRGKYQVGKTWGISYETAKGKKLCRFANFRDCKKTRSFSETIIDYTLQPGSTQTTLGKQLSAKIRELS